VSTFIKQILFIGFVKTESSVSNKDQL